MRNPVLAIAGLVGECLSVVSAFDFECTEMALTEFPLFVLTASLFFTTRIVRSYGL